MSNIIINAKRNEIVITKKFAEAAKRFGSPEYKELKEARQDCPSFKVVVRKTKANKGEHMKGLTYKFMENYISNHDDDEKSTMKTFMDLRAKSEEAEELNAAACSYQEIKEWFLNTYPAIAGFAAKQENIMEKARAKASNKTANVVSIQKSEDAVALSA